MTAMLAALFIFSLFALALHWVLLRIWRYRRCVPYDARRDYLYDFGQTERHEVDFDGRRLAVPALSAECSALILKISLRRAWLGALFDPWISVGGKSLGCTHWFERGARGVRYLNLTELISQEGPCEVTSRHVRILPQTCSLFVFKDRLLPSDRLAVIAPHPDDAEIAAYGLYRAHRDNSWLVILTAGDNTLRYRALAESDRAASELAARLRSTDPLACGALAGISRERIIGLGYFDSTLAEMHRASPAAVASRYGAPSFRDSGLSTMPARGEGPFQGDKEGWGESWPNLVSDLRRVFEANLITAIVCPHPVLDSHEDHFYATLATCEALLQEPRIPAKLLLYTNHHPLSESYPFGPPGAAVTLPPQFETLESAVSLLSHPLEKAMQIEKSFALDCNHALRDLPGSSSPRLSKWLGRVFLGSANYDHSYYRRAIRQNELFFVVQGKAVELLYQAMLSRITR